MGKVLTTRHGFKRTSFNFYEKQRFNNKYLLAFLIFLELVFIYAFVEQELSSRLWGMKPLDTGLLISMILFIPTPFLVFYLITRLETIINDDGIFFRWTPFRKKYQIYDWSAITEITIIQLNNVWPGWGRNSKYGEVHYLGGDFAVLISTRSGKQKLLGTRKPEELNRILTRVAGDKYNNSTDHSFDYS